ncbi:Uncharacterized protein RNJ44_01378 [Nakaseomyces bracarensis]|uniref:EKC/KEOPS complex subunit CGI121 n=1 Tax=Nakaseomyces bracarensis TaxID=273131 RepID=A0ABR4NPI5_9SACH
MLQFNIPQFNQYNIKIGLFQDVENSSELRKSVAEIPLALIDAKMIFSREQLYSALYRVLIELNHNQLRTRSLHSEVLLCLSPTSNIGEAFKKFGINDDTNAIYCVEICGISADSKYNSVTTSIKGTEKQDMETFLKQNRELDLISKMYKLKKDQVENLTEEEISTVISNAIQLRGL